MKKIKAFFLCTLLFCLTMTQTAYGKYEIVLLEQFYQDGNYSIGMLNPVDLPLEQYKPKGITAKVEKHVSKIGEIELTALYLNYDKAPEAHSFWDEDVATREAHMAAVISTTVPMDKDFGFTKLSETDTNIADYNQKDLYYGLLIANEPYLFAFRFIRRGGDEYILVYRAPTRAKGILSAEEYFDTFKLMK